MKRAKALRTLGLLVVTGIASPCATAADSGWYLGGNIGQSRATIDDQRIVAGLLSDGFTTTSIRDDDRDLAFKTFGGYQFNRNFAVESGFFDLGKFGFTATTQPQGTVDGTIKLRGANLDLVGILPITQKFSAFARVGATYVQTRDTFAGTGSANVLNPRRSKNAASYKYGLGLEYDFVPAFGMRLEAERYRIDDAVGNKGDVDLFSLGFVLRFGQNTAVPTRAAVEPVPAAAPPPPPLPPPAPPAPPAPRKLSLSADSMFGFDQSDVNSAGKRELDQLAAELRGSSYEVITVTGHTDRIGTEAYNDALSTRRAEAVKDYLIQAAGIPADKISARGVDGSDPVTKPGDCPGTRVTPELIDCLQPDRRVEVEVTATR